jgi:hypothetical protein
VLTHLLVGVSLPLILAGSDPEWATFAPKGQGFSVLMPGPAAEHQAELKTEAGAVNVTYFVAEDKHVTYVVSCSKFAKGALKADTQEKRLDNARDGALESAGGKLESEKPVKLGPHSGRELLIDGSKAFVRTRIYAMDNKLYQTMAVGSRKHVNGADAKKFLDSFKVIK